MYIDKLLFKIQDFIITKNDMMSNDNSADLVLRNTDPSSRNNDLW